MGIPGFTDLEGPTTRPVKRGGETDVEFRQRELAWMAGQSGVGSGTAGGLGIPAPWFGSVGVTGVRLGDFGVASTANLPPPTRAGVSNPFDSNSPDLYRIDDPNFGDSPSFPADDTSDSHTSPGLPVPRSSVPISLSPGRFGPIGGIVQGLREARDPTPEEIERARVLAATGFDTNWGTPPGGGSGLAWSADRFLYVPDRSKASGSYAFQARDGYYLQPYRDNFGTWRTRWMYAAVATPDVARPYRVVDAQTAGGLSSQIGDPTIDRIKTGEFREDPNAVFVPKYGSPKRAIKLSDYAWVGQKQMPVGCPYPYPAMPVPIADYTSGRWLDADYVPSIPLPPPYDQTPWQCGVPNAPGMPHKGPNRYSGVENFTPPPPATVNPIPSPVDVLLADPKPDPAKVKSALEDSVRRADELRRSVDLALRNGNKSRAAALQGQLDAVESDRRLLTQLKSRLEAEHGKPKVGARPSNGDVGLPPPTGSAAPRSGDGDSRDDPESQTHNDGVHYATPKAPAPGPDRLYAQPKDPPPPAPAPAPTPPPGIPPATRSAVKNPCDIKGPDGEKLLGIEPGSDSTIGGQDPQKADLEKAARSTSGGKEMKADSIRLNRKGAGGAMPGGSSGRGASLEDRWRPRVPSESDEHFKLSTSDGLPIDVYAGRTELFERVLHDKKPRAVRGDELEAQVGLYIGVKGQSGHAYQFAQYVSVAAVQYKLVGQADLTNLVGAPRWHLDAEDGFGSRDYHYTWFQTQGVDRDAGASLMFDMPGSRYSRKDVESNDDRAFDAVALMLESGGIGSGTAETLARAIVGSNEEGRVGGWVKKTLEFRTYIIDTSEHSCGRRTIGVLSFKCSFLFDFAGNKRMTKPEFSGFKFEPMGSQRLR